MVAEMTYRYFFVLAGLARADFLGRRSRTMAPPERAEARGFVAGRAGTLFRRSLELSRQVNLAMVSRGWDGTPRVLGGRPLAARDAAVAALTAALAAGMVISERLLA
jgi:cobalt/nickel transport system permease protein